eukprot:7527002-Karenia_brevis.AAC.1
MRATGNTRIVDSIFFVDIPLLHQSSFETYGEYSWQGEAFSSAMSTTNGVVKKIRRSRDESSLLHIVPHGNAVEDFASWDLTLIAFTMDEALDRMSQLGI